MVTIRLGGWTTARPCTQDPLKSGVRVYLDVGGVLVGLVGGRLQLLADPGLDLVHVAAELLQGLGLAQLGALLDHLGLQAEPPEEQ